MDSDIGMDPFSLILLQKLTAVGERNLKLEEENARLLTEVSTGKLCRIRPAF